MLQTETIEINGVAVQAELIDIVSASEPWTEYLLANGDVLRLRRGVTRIYLVPNLSTPNGQPIYHFQYQDVTDVRSGSKTG